jgi:hypothetical protein
MSCPDDLLDRSNALTESERAELLAHTATCRACALEIGLPDAIARRPSDPRRIARAIDGAIKPRVMRWPGKKTVTLLAAAAVLVCGAAAASMASLHPAKVSAPSEIATVPPVPVTPPARVVEPTIAVDDLPRAVPPTVVPVATQPATSQPSAAELFAKANASRKDGDADGAIAGYRHLIAAWPASHEASTAHVSLGRLLLDRDATTALTEFDRYLDAEPHGDLREDALVGRARASGTLGRTDDERRAWRSLLDEYPGSMYAARAKERLDALR